MNAKLKKLVLMLTITIIFLSFIRGNMKITFSSDTGGKIDLFTQKETSSGKGPNMPSDAFNLGEEVKIYALVTYNGYPVRSLLVAFGISEPKNPIENITFYRAACTNESGIAMISFRIPHLETAFGEWIVTGNVRIDDLTFQDLISFKIGWIVEIVSIKTINEEYMDQEKFTRKNYVGVELALRNIAMTEKKITLTITIYDSLGIRINSTEINNFMIQPGGVLVYFYCFLYIPKSAYVGDAVIYACAYTTSARLGGVPCCPEVSSHFLIINRDIAILSVHPSLTLVYKSEIVNIDVCVKNKGWETESVNVRAYYNETLIDIIPIFDLKPLSNMTIRFIWNTSDVEEGLYLISASVDPVPDEIDAFDNIFDDGFVEVKSPFHDVAILNVTPSSTLIYIGEIVDIYVVVKNQGNYTESFNVTVFYDSDIIGTSLVKDLAFNVEKTLVFHWDTQNVIEGNYTLSALVSQILGEENLENNCCIDGVVEVVAAPKGWFIPDWFYWLLLLLLILIIVLLIVWLYRRKRKKETKEAFYSGWTAWYYGYDPQSKAHN